MKEVINAIYTKPRVHKAFQNKDQDQAQVKQSHIMDFFQTYYNYLTIDRWCLIKYVLQTRLLRILSFFFIKEKVNFIVANVMKI